MPDQTPSSGSPRRNHFKAVPPELLLSIFSYVVADGSKSPLANLASVCKQFVGPARQLLYATVTLKTCREILHSGRRQRFPDFESLRCVGLIRELDILNHDIFQSLANRNQPEGYSCFDFGQRMNILALIKRLNRNQLVSLRIDNPCLLEPPRVRLQSSLQFLDINLLGVNGRQLDRIGRYFNMVNLRHLRVREIIRRNAWAVLSFITANISSLEVIELSVELEEKDDTGAKKPVGGRMPISISVVDLMGLSTESPEDVEPETQADEESLIVQSPPAKFLKGLSLDGVNPKSLKGAQAGSPLMKFIKNIQRLEIVDCALELADIPFFSNFPHLTSLFIHTSAEKEVINDLIMNCPPLKVLMLEMVGRDSQGFPMEIAITRHDLRKLYLEVFDCGYMNGPCQMHMRGPGGGRFDKTSCFQLASLDLLPNLEEVGLNLDHDIKTLGHTPVLPKLRCFNILNGTCDARGHNPYEKEHNTRVPKLMDLARLVGTFKPSTASTDSPTCIDHPYLVAFGSPRGPPAFPNDPDPTHNNLLIFEVAIGTVPGVVSIDYVRSVYPDVHLTEFGRNDTPAAARRRIWS